MMSEIRKPLILLEGLFVVLISLPWLVPHTGALALIAFVPLLCAERIASRTGVKRFWLWQYAAFVLWNAATTWWVCEATVGGGIFAVLANALQMSLIFGLFRFSKKRLKGVLPYIFLAVMWVAWERFYYGAQISWPWIVLGNAFAQSTGLIQWYEFTGTLGGSVWIWAVNLALFGIMVSVSDGRWWAFNAKAKAAVAIAVTLVVAGPIISSLLIYRSCPERDDKGTLEVAMSQSNFDPYQKLRAVPQSEQNAQVIGLFDEALRDRESGRSYPSEPILLMVPETFTNDVILNDYSLSPTWCAFRDRVAMYENANFMFGASAHRIYDTPSAPSKLARNYGRGWTTSHNVAMMLNGAGETEVYLKSKLVVGTELTPFPEIFVPLDNALGGVMGRCEGQDHITLLHVNDYAVDGTVEKSIPVAPVVCYESIYPEYCTGYVREGAQLLTVITNDGWWGDTPGYRQHFSYSRLRAIELRRDVARCANTGISAFIDQRGDVREQSEWWTPALLRGTVNLTGHMTFFARHGDIPGRVCTLAFLLLAALLVVRIFYR